MSMKFFRACPTCNKFFYDPERFRNHKCFETSPEEKKLKEHFEEINSMTSSEDVETKTNTYIPPSTEKMEQDTKKELREKYLAFLKKKGIDLTYERSFRKIKEAYKANGGE